MSAEETRLISSLHFVEHCFPLHPRSELPSQYLKTRVLLKERSVPMVFSNFQVNSWPIRTVIWASPKASKIPYQRLKGSPSLSTPFLFAWICCV